MTSRSATVLVIFIVAVIAFCLASVFASMTGPISILPNETESGGVFDNLSAITDDTSESDNTYDYSDDDDYSSDYSSSYGADGYDVETTSDDSSSSSSSSSDASGYENSAPDVETTTDESSSGSEVETTTG